LEDRPQTQWISDKQGGVFRKGGKTNAGWGRPTSKVKKENGVAVETKKRKREDRARRKKSGEEGRDDIESSSIRH